MKKHIVAIIILTVYIVACLSGCGTVPMQSGGPSGQSSPGASDPGSTASAYPDNATQTATDGTQTSGTDVPFTFSAAKTAVPMQPLDVRDLSEYELLEDAEGVIHMVYTKYDSNCKVYHRCLGADGTWSAGQTILDVDGGHQVLVGFHTLLSPDGRLCLLWVERVTYETPRLSSWTDLLHVEYYKDCSFEQGPVIDYKKDGEPVDISISSAFFDGHGTLQCLYYSNNTLGRGYYLSGHRLTQHDSDAPRGMNEVPVAEGLSHWGTFMVDSQGVCHLFNTVGERYTSEQTLMHSYSKDNGATWEGPYTVLEKLPNFTFACSGDTNGNIRLLINKERYDTNTEPHLILCTLKAGSYEVASSQAYLSSDEKRSVPNGDPELSSFHFCVFHSMRQNKDGSLYFIGMSSLDYYVATLKKNGTWDIRMLSAPDISLRGVFFRNSGNLFVFGSDSEIGTDGILVYHWGELGW